MLFFSDFQLKIRIGNMLFLLKVFTILCTRDLGESAFNIRRLSTFIVVFTVFISMKTHKTLCSLQNQNKKLYNG